MIIPARNAARVLPRTLAALGDADVVVVDNASTDTTAATARAHGARVVTEPVANRGRARNAGARATDAELLAFLDADCTPDPGWLDALTRCLTHHALVGGRVIVEGGGFDAAWRLKQETTIATEGWSGAGNLGIRRSRFEELGGFDERFTHAAEDVDLCLRAGAIAYCPDAIVRHAAATTTRQILARGFRHGYGSTQLGTRRDWRHPKPLVAGDWALRRFGLEDRPDLKWPARADYAGRVAGSLWAELRRAR